MTQVLLLFLLGKGNFYFKHGLIFILLLTQGDAQSTLNLYMASEAALFPSRTGANVQRQMISISSCLVSRQLSLQLKKIRWESQRKHAFFFSEEYSVLFSCHAFARGFGWFVAWNFSFRTVTMCSLSHSSVLQTEPCQQSQQVWVHRRLEHCTEHPREEQKRKLKKKKNLLIRQNKHHRFLRMPDVSSDAPAVRLSSQTESRGIVISWSPSLCCVSCDLTLQQLSSVWRKRTLQRADVGAALAGHRFQSVQQTDFNLFFSLKTIVVRPSLNVCWDIFHIFRTSPPHPPSCNFTLTPSKVTWRT